MIFSENETETLLDLLEAVASGRALTSSDRGTAGGLAERFQGRQAPAPREVERPRGDSDAAPPVPTQIDAAAIYAKRRGVVEAAMRHNPALGNERRS